MNATKALTRTEAREENAKKLVGLVESRRDQLQKMLVGQDVERFMTVTLQAVTSNPDLLDADPISVLSAIREAATYGLEPVGPLGDGAIIPYKGAAQFQPMYRGLMKLARRSGHVSAIDSKVVFEHDSYEREFGTDPFVRHIPAPLGAERGKFVGVYAYARLRSGELVVVELNLADIDRVKKSSRGGTIWQQWPEQMMMKTALKRLMKLLPLETKAAEAMALDDRIEAAEEVVRPIRENPARGRLVARLTGASGTAEEPSGGDDAPQDEEAVSVDPSPVPEPGDEGLTDEEIDELLEDPTDLDPNKVVEFEEDEKDLGL